MHISRLPFLLILLIYTIVASLSSFAATLNVSCSEAPKGFSVALVGDAGQYAERKAKLECSSNCQKISETRVKTQKPLLPGQSFSFRNTNVAGFGARGTVAAELCKDGATYKGDKVVEITYLVNDVVKTARIAGAIAMPDFQFTTQSGQRESSWEFKLETIK